MGEHRILEPEAETEIKGDSYRDESGKEPGLLVSFVCPFCSTAGSLSLWRALALGQLRGAGGQAVISVCNSTRRSQHEVLLPEVCPEILLVGCAANGDTISLNYK